MNTLNNNAVSANAFTHIIIDKGRKAISAELKKTKLSIMCIALWAASSAVCAQSPIAQGNGLSSEIEHVDASQNRSVNSAPYPKYEVLLSLYQDLKKMGLIKKGERPLAFDSNELIVDERLLRNVYDWAIDNKLVTAEDLTLRADILRSNAPYFAKSTAGCLTAYAACVGEVVSAPTAIAGIACVAAAAEAGANPTADAWCAIKVKASYTAVGATCLAGIVEGCKGNPPDPELFEAERFGSDQGRNTFGTCNQVRAMVTSISAWTNNGVITKIKATCSDGSTFTVGNGVGSEQTRACGAKHVGSGLRGKASDKIDAVGLLCDNTPEVGNKWKPVGTLMGGTGGTNYESFCPNNTGYLHGIKATLNRALIADRRFIHSIRAVCRNY